MGAEQGARSPNRTVVLDTEACSLARRGRGLSREALSALATGPHPISVATLKRAEAGQPVYLATARRIAELLQVPVEQLLPSASSSARVSEASPSAPAAISVMPFQWLGADPSGAYLAIGLTEDLLARLSRWWFPVIAPSIAPRLGEIEPAPSDVRSLSVRYWIEGSVRRHDDQVRVIARLVSGDDAKILWTQTYDRRLDVVLGFQEEMATRIAAEIGQNVIEAEAARVQRAQRPQLSAWEMSLVGAWHFQRVTRHDNAKARSLLAQAVALEPNLPLAWYTLAMTHRLDIINRWSESQAESLRALHETGTRFADAHPYDAGPHIVAAYVDVLVGARDTAAPRLDSAIAIDPSHCTAYSVLGQTLAFRGDGDAAVEQFELALRLRPVSIENWQPMIGMALAHFVAGRYEETVAWSHQANRLRPDMPIPLATLAVANAYLGEQQAAADTISRLRAMDASVNVGSFQALGRSAEVTIAERFYEGLRRAGLSD